MANVKENIISYGKSTSVKGVAKAVKSQQKSLKFIWLVAFVIGGAVGLYFIIRLLMKYYDYQVTTKVTVCNGCHPELPDITLCNLNPTNILFDFKGVILQLDQFLHLINTVKKDEAIDMEEVFGTSDITLLEDVYIQMFSLSGYFHNINKMHLFDIMMQTGYKKYPVQYCDWFDWNDSIYSKEDCLHKSQHLFISDEYFLCTTLHLNETNSQSHHDEVKGLQAIIYLNEFYNQLIPQYNPNILSSQAKGLRIHVHPAGTLPEVQKGFNVPPGHEVKVSLKPIKVTHLPEPYSECLENPSALENVSVDMTDNPYASITIDYRYSDKAAAGICKQEKIIQKCGCYVHTLPFTVKTKAKYPNIHGCHYIDGIEGLTLQEDGSFNMSQLDMKTLTEHIDCYLNDIDGGVLDKECAQPMLCEEHLYDYQVSQTPWPHESYQLAFYCDYIRDPICSSGLAANTPRLGPEFHVYEDIIQELILNDYLLNVTGERLKNVHLIKENFIQLKVIFDHAQLIEYVDVPFLTAEALFGNLGGLFNLWIGITFFTIVELLDLLFKICSDSCKKEKKNLVSDFQLDNKKSEK